LEEVWGRWPLGYAQDKFQGRREGEREIGADNDPQASRVNYLFVTCSGKESIE